MAQQAFLKLLIYYLYMMVFMDTTTTLKDSKPKFSLIAYLKNSYIELKKVTWPTREAAIQSTVTVIVFSIILAIFLGALDFLFNIGLDYLLKLQ